MTSGGAGSSSGAGPASFPRPRFTWRLAGGRTLSLGERTRVMGILNVTPDSFSDGGRLLDPERALAAAEAMLAAGADILDIGGESTRPGSRPVPADEEVARVIPVIREAARLGAIISIDTTKVEVARAALEAGASIINDISGLRFEPGLAGLARESGAGLVLMHSRGTPRDMQDDPRYNDVVREVAGELEAACRLAEAAGAAREQIVIDPGLGFAKSAAHNLEILSRLDELVAGGRPVLVGASRKSFLGRILDRGVEERLVGSLAAAVAAVMSGAHIVRVHDVDATVQAVRVADAIREGSSRR